MANSRESDVFEEGMETSNARTVHRLRANSSIMKETKLLGESSHLLL